MAFDKNHMSTGMKVVVVVFAVILVLMLMLPSLSAIVGNKGAEKQAQQQAQQEQPQGPQSAADLDKLYQPAIDSLNKRLESDPKNVAMLNDLANAYFDWGMRLSFFSTEKDVQTHQQDIFKKAIEAYDKVLAESPSNSVTVDRAIAVFYSGQPTQAISDLEAFTQKTPDFAPAWANLGNFYLALGDVDKAKADLQKAIDLDKDGSQGVKQFAESRIQAIDAMKNATAQPTPNAEGALPVETKPAEGESK